MGVFFATVVATVALFYVVPTGFIPSEDTGQLSASTEASPDTSFEAMIGYQQQLAEIVKKDPNVDAVMSSVGGFTGGSNRGRLTIRLKPRGERKLTADEIIQELRPKLARIPRAATRPSSTSGRRRCRSGSRRSTSSRTSRAT
jgi:HAE1 family hydrophobic/amphiphilic exporter-1